MQKLIIILFLALVSVDGIFYSQDTSKTKKIDTTYKPVKFILSYYKHSYLNQTNPDTVTRRRFLWYPLKTIDDLFNYLPGYYLKYMDVGQINQINYNQLSPDYTGVFRHGRPINDLIDGSIDLNLLSRNEIAEVELTNGFGNFLYNYSNGINIIDRQIFQYRPYTEISYFQDRYENLYFDGNYHQNLFKNFNFNFGITKHSYAGKYTNSDFDKWLGRFNFNFAASNKLNFFLYSNYAKIQRGLNEGINPDTVNIGSREDMFDVTKAIVRYDKAHENKERFDIDAGAVFETGKNSFTKLQIYESNSLRQYHQLINLVDPLSPMKKTTFHWINYGGKIQQIFNFKLWKSADLISRSEVEYNFLKEQVDSENQLPLTVYREDKTLSFIEDVSFSYKNLTLGVFGKGFSPKYSFSDESIFESFCLTSGVKAAYRHEISKTAKLNASGMYTALNNYFSGSIDFNSPIADLGLTYYNYQNRNDEPTLTLPPKVTFQGINGKLRLKIFKIVLDALYSYNFKNDYNDIMPEHSGKINLSFDDNAFKNKLEYKIGFATRYWSEHKAVFYSGGLNRFTDTYLANGPNNYRLTSGEIPANATLDFFIIGKIGRATFGLTLENILNRLVYNTGVYPFMDRGGLFNVISRFNITWNFLD